MKNIRANLIRFTVPCILLLVCSCGKNNLSDSKAEKALKNEYPRYITSTIQISDKSLSPRIPDELKLLSEKELTRYNYIPPGTRGYGCYGELTEEGKKYFVSKISNEFIVMAIAKVELDVVTGVREIPAMNASEVEYREKIVEVTPVGEIFNDISLGKTYNVNATFNKYNDGWRIDRLSTRAQKFTISENLKMSNVDEKIDKEEAWTDFWSDFSNAVKQKDKATLLKLAINDSEFDGGAGGEIKNDWAERIISNEEWEIFIADINKGVVPDEYRGKGGKITKECALYFEFKNNKWYWAGVLVD
jgi:hypothetical protein